ncbi:MAG TPA: energy transducer TonB [Vicinamibacterales bacterium]
MSAVSALRWSPQADDTVYTTSDAGVQPPVLIHEVKPQYTDAAKKRKVQGTVDREAVVTREGQVRDDIRVVKSLDPDLDAQAIKALQQWQFRPATKDGKPANITVQVETTFTLK